MKRKIISIIKEEIERHFEKKSFVALSTTVAIKVKRTWMLGYKITIVTNRNDIWIKNRDLNYKIKERISDLTNRVVTIQTKENILW